MASKDKLYWKANLRLIFWCLSAWFTVSLLFGVLIVELLNKISIAGYPLGFWFAQQGSIYTFIAIVFFYAWRMNALDQHFNDQKE